ncbi:MAG: hypothetical protein ABSE44_05930 [Candidatus Sulfotelmatobacter sp.]
MTSKPDYVEVGRKAHELSRSHGWNAYKYAAKLAADALAEGKVEESELWKSVEASLTPREKSN